MSRTRDATAADDESLPAALLATWGFTIADAAPTLVVPDGCRDLILHQPAHGSPRWFVTDLDRRPRTVSARLGDRFSGYRLHPGAVVDVAGLLDTLDGRHDGVDRGAVLDRLDAHVVLAPDVEEALALLSAGRSVQRTACDLSWSVSRVQRRLRATTGWSPSAWRSLARARRAARTCASDALPLAEAAADHGFADQPHMTRELRRWFATTPGALRAGASALPQLWSSGYGDATGVQISTRNPSTSRT